MPTRNKVNLTHACCDYRRQHSCFDICPGRSLYLARSTQGFTVVQLRITEYYPTAFPPNRDTGHCRWTSSSPGFSRGRGLSRWPVGRSVGRSTDGCRTVIIVRCRSSTIGCRTSDGVPIGVPTTDYPPTSPRATQPTSTRAKYCISNLSISRDARGWAAGQVSVRRGTHLPRRYKRRRQPVKVRIHGLHRKPVPGAAEQRAAVAPGVNLPTRGDGQPVLSACRHPHHELPDGDVNLWGGRKGTSSRPAEKGKT